MFTLDLEGIGLSLMNRKMLEVVYLSMNSLKFEYSSSPVAQAVNLSLGTLQIDNQLHDAIYPVLLQPTPIPKEASAVASPPTIQASVIWLNDQGATPPTTLASKRLTLISSSRCIVHQVLFDLATSLDH
jgi:vacuolar protein sorting-associated protein 13A/C